MGSNNIVTLSDLTKPLLGSKDYSKKRLLTLSTHHHHKTTRHSDKKKGGSKEKKKTDAYQQKATLVAPPLSNVETRRIQRQVAYTETSRDITKWLPIVVENRKADALSFPLDKPEPQKATTASLSSRFQPTTELEMKIEDILKQAGLSTSTSTLTQTTLPENALSFEDIKKRQIELQKIKSFLFFQEQKQKQASKIKSKNYHRIKKKDRLKNKSLQSITDPDALLQQRTKMEIERVKERMTLRHKHTNKHANLLDGSATEHQLMADEYKRIQELKTKMGIGKEDLIEEPGETVNGGENPIKEPHPHSKLFNMKFMKKSLENTHDQSSSENEGLSDSELDSDEEEEGKVIVGRRIFNKHEPEEIENRHGMATQSKSSITIPSTDIFGHVRVEPKALKENHHDDALESIRKKNMTLSEIIHETEQCVNPWLTVSSSCKIEDSSHIESKPADVRRSDEKKDSKKRKQKPITIIGLDYHEGSSDEGLELNEESIIGLPKDLIQQAFANDDAIREFEEEKKRIIDSEAPHDEDATLPGWGSWGGPGIDESKTRRIIKKAKPGEGIEPNKRRDAKLKHVIINEKKINSIQKYQIDKLPYPFENKAQYEQSQRMPLGREWNAFSVYQSQIQPRVMIESGTVIPPLKLSNKKR